MFVCLGAKLILSLRKMTEAQRIIYVCSNHKLPSKNVMDMALLDGENNEYVGTDPFFPTRVIPVDISPHSLRCELVILLERLDMAKLPKPKRTAPHKTIGCLYYGVKRKPFDKKKSGKRGGLRGAGQRSAMPRGGGRYPPPMRGGPYMKRGGFVVPPQRFDYGPPIPYMPHRSDLNRYSDFHRDVESAIDSFPPPRAHVSKRLAMANAMLEQGIRLASEAMAEDYPMVRPVPTQPYMRGRGNVGGSWARNAIPHELQPTPSWGRSWGENHYAYDMRSPRGRGSRGFRHPEGLGMRGGGAWR